MKRSTDIREKRISVASPLAHAWSPTASQKKSRIAGTSDHFIVVLFESAFIQGPHTPSDTADASLPPPIG
jgi:hypothetical protein